MVDNESREDRIRNAARLLALGWIPQPAAGYPLPTSPDDLEWLRPWDGHPHSFDGAVAEMRKVRFVFRIPIGDWSGDGHGRCEDFYATAAKPGQAVHDAYFAAKARLPALCPESFCHKYEDGKVPQETIVALKAAGCPLPEMLEPDEDGASEGLGPEGMVVIVAWFLNQGDPDLDVKLEPVVKKPPILPLCGKRGPGPHIGFIGYGLF